MKRQQVLVVSNEMMTAVCTCRRLPCGQSVYQFNFNAPPQLTDSVPSIIFTSDGVNLVTWTVKPPADGVTPASDSVLFIVRRVNTGVIVAKTKPNYPEFR